MLTLDREATLRAVFETAPIGMALLRPDGCFLEVNPTLGEMVGCAPADLRGRSFLRLAHPDDRQDLVRLGRRLLEGRALEPRFVKRYVTRRGDTRWAVLTVTLAREPDGEPRFVAQVMDISMRRRTEQELRHNEEQYGRIFESVTEGLVVLSSERAIVDANPAVCRMHGCSRTELLRRRLEHLVDPASQGQIDALFTAIAVGREYQCEARGLRGDGQTFDLELLAAPFRFHGDESVLAVHRDITARKNAERKVAEYTSALESSNRDLEDFASVASHDLQAPLRKIRTFASRLDRGGSDARSVTRILDAAEWASTLIRELLAYSRLTSREGRFAPIHLDDVMGRVRSLLDADIERAGGRLEIGPLPQVVGDATQIRQLLQNLIVNSLKFRHPDRDPVVRVSGERTQGLFGSRGGHPGGWRPMVRITIADNGIGFDEEYRAQIFGVFQRLHGSEYEGTGMGLAICRRIVDRHHGKITAYGTPGEGATFVVSLPAS
jgi:PAS domain S-box-containing protein